jgi:hypothetical protein
VSRPNIDPRPGVRGPTLTLSRSPRPDEGLPFKTLLTTAAVQVSIGGLFLALTCGSPTPIAYRAWAGAVILAAAVVQGKLVLKTLKQQRVVRGNIFRRTSFWRTAFVGVVLCYLASLALGPNPGTPYAFAAAVSVWYTLLLLPIAASPEVFATWKRLAQKKIPRRAAGAIFASILMTVVAEVSLRSYTWVTNHDWFLAEVKQSQPAGFAAAGVVGLPNAAMNLDGDSRFHVAIVGDEVTLGGIHNDGALSQLEVLVPGVRVTNFSIANVGPREYAQNLAQRVIECHPDLVLTFVSVGDDILAESAGSDWFDWRSLELSRLRFTRRFVKPAAPEAMPFLQRVGRELVVCRTPIDPQTNRRWQKVFRHLDALVRTCQRSNVDVALVVAPSEFQVNHVLLETLCRRMGYEQQEIDLDLPQRRLATFAGDHQVPCVDLLPHLRLCEEPPYERSTRQWNAEGTAIALRTVGGWLQSCYGDVIPATGQVSKK